MGTGKSTIGRRVADDLRMNFVDSDHAIESQAGTKISEIFEQRGEAYFRELEKAFIESGHPSSGMVVACGGGLVVQPGMLELLETKGVVVCLVASEATILQRVATNRNRPLLDVDDQEQRIRRLLQEREPVYKRVNSRIMTDHRPVGRVVVHVTRTYLDEVRRMKRYA